MTANLELNPLLSDRSRLLIMALLAAAPAPVDFTTLCEELKMTKGNLSSHMRRLEESGMVRVEKAFVDRKPLTTYCCTKQGRTEVKSYLNQVEKLLKQI